MRGRSCGPTGRKDTLTKPRIAYFIPFQGCGRRCVYCDQGAITGASGEISPEMIEKTLATRKEPVELCFFGGSFARLPEGTLTELLDTIHTAPGGSKITFSSYPGDFAGPEGERRVELLKSYPIGTIELGIPSLDPNVLRACGRDDDIGEIVSAVARLRSAGFHLGVQIMIGLPGQEHGGALGDLRELAVLKGKESWDLRIYPCLVLRGTALQNLYESGDFAPLSLEDAVRQAGELLLEAEALGFIVVRAGLLESSSLRDSVVAGPYHPAFGELARAEKLVLRLHGSQPHGPWRIPEKSISLLTGHGGRGLKRIAEISKISVGKAKKKIIRISEYN